MHDVISIPELEQLARRTMPTVAYEYVAAGAADEQTVRWNTEAFHRLRLRPRALEDVASVDTRLTLFGDALQFPILLAPVAYHRALHADGELATARGAGAAGAVWVVSTGTTTPLEQIARAALGGAGPPLWFQLYMQRDRGVTRDIVARAEAVGCRTICLTVDTPVLGARDRQARARFALPPGVSAPYMGQTGGAGPVTTTHRDVVVTWRDVEWLKSFTRVPLLLKGILTGDDAERALGLGVDGVIVSNHGGRNLDTLPAAVDALPAVADRVGGRVPVLVDGGVRRGTDVLKALALGARAVLVGRPYCYGLALGGDDGVRRVVEILRTELEWAMQLTGRRTLAEVDRSVLWDATR